MWTWICIAIALFCVVLGDECALRGKYNGQVAFDVVAMVSLFSAIVIMSFNTMMPNW